MRRNWNPEPPIHIPSTAQGIGRPLLCHCQLPEGGHLGNTWRCGFCGQVWTYTTDNVAACFWVHAGPLKRMAYRFTKGRS